MAEIKHDIDKIETFDAEEQTEPCAGEETKEAETDVVKEKKEKKSELKKLRGEAEKMRKELADTKTALSESEDKYLRLYAEYDNFRKRSQTEREGIYGAAISDALTGLLPIIDNLQIAQKYSGGDSEKIAKGVEMILSKLPETLEKLGVKAFGEVGEKFDPNLHNAVMHEDDETKGENEIVEVLQCGYMYGEKVLRYAMVKVAN